MHILVLHRMLHSLGCGTRAVEHRTHDVVDVGVPDRAASLPDAPAAGALPWDGPTALESLASASSEGVRVLPATDALRAGRDGAVPAAGSEANR